MAHPDKTCFADRVVYIKNGTEHVASVIGVYTDDPHKADLLFYCEVAHKWDEVYGVKFGTDFKNPEA